MENRRQQHQPPTLNNMTQAGKGRTCTGKGGGKGGRVKNAKSEESACLGSGIKCDCGKQFATGMALEQHQESTGHGSDKQCERAWRRRGNVEAMGNQLYQLCRGNQMKPMPTNKNSGKRELTKAETIDVYSTHFNFSRAEIVTLCGGPFLLGHMRRQQREWTLSVSI